MNILITGFPGFIAQHLLRELCQASQTIKFIFLIEGRFEDSARSLCEELGLKEGQFKFVHFNLSTPGLGLSSAFLNEVNEVSHVFHLAALYDLTASREISFKINVEGTVELLKLFEKSTKLKKFNYVSTCFVCGKSQGAISENELLIGQEFNNFYEETKYLAEVEVEKWRQRLPIAVFRPAIVVGHSISGETAKFDGPIVLARFLSRLRRVIPFMPVFPQLGSSESYLSLIPVDVVARTLSVLGLEAMWKGTVHIAPHETMTSEMVLKHIVTWFYPQARLISFQEKWRQRWINLLSLFGVTLVTGMTRHTLHYLNFRAQFSTLEFEKCCKTFDIRVPLFKDYVPQLMQFVNDHERPFPFEMLGHVYRKWVRSRFVMDLIVGFFLLSFSLIRLPSSGMNFFTLLIQLVAFIYCARAICFAVERRAGFSQHGLAYASIIMLSGFLILDGVIVAGLLRGAASFICFSGAMIEAGLLLFHVLFQKRLNTSQILKS